MRNIKYSNIISCRFGLLETKSSGVKLYALSRFQRNVLTRDYYTNSNNTKRHVYHIPRTTSTYPKTLVDHKGHPVP